MKMTKLIGIAFISAMVVGCSNAQVENEPGTEQVSQNSETTVTLVGKAEFKQLMEKEGAQLVDVRTPGEVANGKIGNAVNMNYHDADFKQQLETLDKEQPVLIYCASGGRSARAVSMMRQMGFTEIHELDGGYGAWSR